MEIQPVRNACRMTFDPVLIAFGTTFYLINVWKLMVHLSGRPLHRNIDICMVSASIYKDGIHSIT